MTSLFLPLMVERNFGYIQFVASVAGLVPIPNYQVYGATKAFVKSFSLSLRVELEGTGVYFFFLIIKKIHTHHSTTSVVCPPHSTTGFQEVANQPKDFFYKMSHVTAGNVVKESLGALEGGSAKVIPGFQNKVCFLCLFF
jgi:short-subunit dehydrogenase